METSLPIGVRGLDGLSAALSTNLLEWRTSSHCAAPLVATIIPKRVGSIRLIDLHGGPVMGERGSREIAHNDDSYIGIVYQRRGRTLCRRGDDASLISAGDIAVWHSDQAMSFEMPEDFHKLCMVVPESRFEAVLPNAASYSGLHLTADNPLAVLLGGYLDGLADRSVGKSEGGIESAAMDITLELLGAALSRARRAERERPRTSLFQRITRYIEHRLSDPSLSPNDIASAHGISLRYLYLLFSEQDSTVSGWIRARRLARCCADLSDVRDRSITEVAFAWGFNDSAHFSRVFKGAYGVCPKAFRADAAARTRIANC